MFTKLAAQMDLTSLRDLLLAQDSVGDTTPMRNAVDAEKPNKNYCMVYCNNQLYKGNPGQTVEDIIRNNQLTNTTDIAYINVFNDVAIIEYLMNTTLIPRIVSAIKQIGTYKKIYSYQDQRGTKIKREASK